MLVKYLPWEESVMVKRAARMVRGSVIRDQAARRAPKWVLNGVDITQLLLEHKSFQEGNLNSLGDP